MLLTRNVSTLESNIRQLLPSSPTPVNTQGQRETYIVQPTCQLTAQSDQDGKTGELPARKKVEAAVTAEGEVKWKE